MTHARGRGQGGGGKLASPLQRWSRVREPAAAVRRKPDQCGCTQQNSKGEMAGVRTVVETPGPSLRICCLGGGKIGMTTTASKAHLGLGEAAAGPRLSPRRPPSASLLMDPSWGTPCSVGVVEEREMVCRLQPCVGWRRSAWPFRRRACMQPTGPLPPDERQLEAQTVAHPRLGQMKPRATKGKWIKERGDIPAKPYIARRGEPRWWRRQPTG